LSAVLVYVAVSRDGGGGSSAPAEGSTQVVVAKTGIAQRTEVTAEMLELKNVPTDTVVEGAFVNVNDVVGQVTKFPIGVNQQVVASAVVDTSAPTVDALSYVVPAGRRAMSVSASQVTYAGGLILPGDYVDVVWICCQGEAVVSRTIVRNVQVAAVAQGIVDSGPVAGENGSNDPAAADPAEADPEASTVTLLLNPRESQDILLAENQGSIRLNLRGPGDAELVDPGTTLLTDILPLQELLRLPNEIRPDGYKDGQQ
jgi:pilus assembly protein CpaB